jgi:hypothetical protein
MRVKTLTVAESKMWQKQYKLLLPLCSSKMCSCQSIAWMGKILTNPVLTVMCMMHIEGHHSWLLNKSQTILIPPHY